MSYAIKTDMDTITITPEKCTAWKDPIFQRPLRQNAKVRALAEEIRSTAVLPGVITLGKIKDALYLIDGQHRRAGFLLSGAPEALVDVRIITFKDETQMGLEFVNLNSSFVRMTPDDIMRGLEKSSPALDRLRKRCSFVGYGSARRGSSSLLSMSVALRCWKNSASLRPSRQSLTAQELVDVTSVSDVDELIGFLSLAFVAFGDSPENYRFWGNLNLTICMWLYRNVVLADPGKGTGRSTRISSDLFRRCLISVAADSEYNEFLVNRNMGERNRAPAYKRVKAIFIKRAAEEKVERFKLPSPEWAQE